MKVLIKLIKWVVLIVIVLLLGLFIFVQLSWKKSYDAPYPDIKASTDSAVIARGEYLVYGPAHCVVCHVPVDQMQRADEGEHLPLIGGWEIEIPPGVFRAPNITPDPETGIGNLTDGELARVLRNKVMPDGRAAIPFMPFESLTDDDLTAIISFIRAQKPIRNEVPDHEFSFLGKAVMAFGLIKPVGPSEPPPKSIAMDTSAAYGKYIVESYGDCKGCHTNRSLKTGEYTGVPLAGGAVFPPDDFSKGFSFITPNLTQHETGVLYGWSQEKFVKRLKKGRQVETSPMPWGAVSRMKEDEMKAVYNYLITLTPEDNPVPKTVFAPGEKLP